MSSFVNADLGSDSDSDDGDFDPTKELGHEAVSEEENSGDDENPSASQSKKKKKDQKVKSRDKGCFQSENPDESSDRKEEFEKEQEELQELATQKKNEDIWSDFLKDVGPTKKVKKPGSGLGALSSISKPKKSATGNELKPKSKPKPAKSSIDSLFDTFESGQKIETVEEKLPEKPTELPKSLMSSIFESVKNKTSAEDEKSDEKSDNMSEDAEGKMKITKVFDFAGEAVEVTKEVEKDSKEAKQFIKQQEKAAESSNANTAAAQKRPGGLGSIMGIISDKKPKMGTLDKSKMDWNKFVDEEGIKEDLQSHNRGKDGYVEKQMFLERADHRRFEIEKAAREKSRKNLTNN